MSKTAIIIGATGLTGTELVHLLEDDSKYSKIILLVRNRADIFNSSKVEQVIFNFDSLSPDKFIADDFFCCLGTTIKKAGSKKEFEKVDYHYVVDSANLAYKNGIRNFAVVSAMGSNKNSKIFYNRVKGKMEQAISEIGFDKCIILRPSLIIGNRKEFRFGEWLAKIFMLALVFLIPAKYKAVHAQKIAKTMVNKISSEESGIITVESDEIYRVENETI